MLARIRGAVPGVLGDFDALRQRLDRRVRHRRIAKGVETRAAVMQYRRDRERDRKLGAETVGHVFLRLARREAIGVDRDARDCPASMPPAGAFAIRSSSASIAVWIERAVGCSLK